MADDKKKQIPLRLSPTLFNKIANWAEDDFRSINSQIEYLLTQCVNHREKKEDSTQKQDTNNPPKK